MDATSKTGRITEAQFEDCLQKSFLQDTAEVVREVVKAYGDSSDEHAEEFGRETTTKVMFNMISTCKAFFVYMDSLRYADFASANRDSLKTVISKGEKLPAAEKTAEVHASLAYAYFLMKDFDKAIPELDSLLASSPDNSGLLFTKGFIREMQGKYDEAMTLYQRSADISGQETMGIFVEIAKRKKAGY